MEWRILLGIFNIYVCGLVLIYVIIIEVVSIGIGVEVFGEVKLSI